MSRANPFERTLTSLRGDGFRRGLAWMLVGCLFAVLWAAWLIFARVPVYVTSSQARLEVTRDAFRIEARVAGQVRTVAVEVGQTVEAGDVLFEIEGEAERRRLQEEQARLAGLEAQLTAVRGELGQRRSSVDDESRSAEAGLEEARSRLEAARSAAQLARQEADRAQRLLDQGLTSSSEAERLRSVARQRQAEVESASRGMERLRASASAATGEGNADLAATAREVARLEAEKQVSRQAVERLREELAWRTVRAPARGRVGELALRRVGRQVEVGEHLATLIPEADLLAVASFAPAQALGRVAAGQAAEIRLDGFPWTEFGILSGRVLRVAGEPRDGEVRVELEVEDAAAYPVVLRHGLPATVLVRVEHASPLSLLLRAVGHAGQPREPAAETPAAKTAARAAGG